MKKIREKEEEHLQKIEYLRNDITFQVKEKAFLRTLLANYAKIAAIIFKPMFNFHTP